MGDGGFCVGGDGNGAEVAIFSLFLIKILCGRWWVVIFHRGGG